MGLVESDTALFTTPMETKHTLCEYDHVFKAQVDTIEAHGGNPGYHGTVYQEHYNALTVSKGCNAAKKLAAVGDTEKK